MSFRGNLKTLALSDILQTLAMNAQTGVLRLVRRPGGAIRVIRFESGEVRNTARVALVKAAAKPAAPAPGPGKGGTPPPPAPREFPPMVAYFVGRCLISDEQAVTLAKQLSTGEQSAVELVASLGYAQPETARHLVQRFHEEEVYEVFTWDDADFEFIDGAPEPGVFSGDAPAVKLRLSTGSLVMEAARRIDEWGRLRQTLPSAREILAAAPGSEKAGAALDPVMRRVMALADGTRDIDDLVAESWISRYEVGGILSFLLSEGLLRSAAVADLEKAGSVLWRGQNWARLVKVNERLLALGKDTPEIRTRLADAAARAGDPERAVIHMSVLADRALEEGREPSAVETWQRILDLLPRNIRANQGLAEYFNRQGRKEDCLKHYIALSKAHTAAGAHDRAVAAAQAALEAVRKEPKARSLLAEALEGAGRGSEAADEYEQLAEEHARAGDARASADALRRALHLEPTRESTRKRLGLMLNSDSRKRSLRRKIVIISAIVLAVGGTAGWLAYNEFKVAQPFFESTCREAEKIEGTARELAHAKRYDEAIAELEKARATYARVGGVWSITDYPAQASERSAACAKLAGQYRTDRDQLELEIARNSAQKRKEADAHFAAGRLEQALDLFGQLQRHGKEADRIYAGEQLRLVERNLSEIQSAVAKAGSYTSDKEELDVVRDLVKRYPEHPKVRALTFPVRIETEPTGAEVRLGGAAQPGLTPCALRLAVAGKNELTFSCRGFTDMSATVTLGTVPASGVVRVGPMARKAAWTRAIEAPVDAPMTAVPEKGWVLFGDRSGKVWCVSAADGAVVWKRALGELAGVTGGITLREGTAYVGTLDGQVCALDINNQGRDRWKPFKADGLIRGAPQVAPVPLLNNQQYLFAATEDGWVYCLDLATGAQRWKSQKLGAVSSPLVVVNGTVYAASHDEHIHALSAADGSEQWKQKLGAALRSRLLVAGGTLYVGADDDCLSALDLNRKEIRWRQPARGAVRAGPVPAGGTQLCFASSDGEVSLMLDPTDAKPGPLRQWALGSAVSGAPLVAGSRIYVGTNDGHFRALDRSGDRECWRFKTAGPVRSSAAVVGAMVVVGSDDGFLYGFDEPEARQ